MHPLCFTMENEDAILQMSTPLTRNGYNNKRQDPRNTKRDERGRKTKIKKTDSIVKNTVLQNRSGPARTTIIIYLEYIKFNNNNNHLHFHVGMLTQGRPDNSTTTSHPLRGWNRTFQERPVHPYPRHPALFCKDATHPWS